MRLNMMDCVLRLLVVPIIVILLEIRSVLSISSFSLLSVFALLLRSHLSQILRKKRLLENNTDSRRRMSECNQTVNCHITNSTLYPIQPSSPWHTRQDLTSCRVCKRREGVSRRKESRDDGKKERERGKRKKGRCPLLSLHLCTCIIASLSSQTTV